MTPQTLMDGVTVTDLLIVATPQEARYLPSDATVEITGAGLVRAAVATTRAILHHRPHRVINLGSVGSLRPELTGLQRPSAVINRDVIAKTDDVASLMGPARIALGGDGPVLGSGDSLVTEQAERDALLPRCDIVDMEGYAIAFACQQLSVELIMVKHVSDFADDGALDWVSIVDESARALARAYDELH